VDYRGRRWVLTVAHIPDDNGRWAIEMGFVDGKGAKVYVLGDVNYLGLGNLNAKTAVLDAAYVNVPNDLQPLYQPTNEQGLIVKSVPRIIFQPDLCYVPKPNRIYGFSGNILAYRAEYFGTAQFSTELAYYTNLKLVGEDEQFYFFKLPFTHPGHEFFEGTSGSPICDAKNNIAGLVCGPGFEPDTIRGIKMHFFRMALDVQSQELDGEEDEGSEGKPTDH
jgi:hypothetical protein